MKVREILKTKGQEIQTIRPESTVSTAAHLLKLHRIGALVVSEDGAKIAGIFSERDLVGGLVRFGSELSSQSVSSLMTHHVKTCDEAATITDVMAEMTRSRVRHLPVVEDGKLCGIISIGDVVKHRLDELSSETNLLRDYIVARS